MLVVARGADRRARAPLAVARRGARVGLAFEVKLFQALIPVPALAVLYVAASPLPSASGSRGLCGRRGRRGGGPGWFLVVSTAPAREQPWAYGSPNGSALSAAFAYDGVDRLRRPPVGRSHHAGVGGAAPPAAPGPLRLVAGGGELRSWLGPS